MSRVTMTHARTRAEIDVPESAVKIYERSGWKRQGEAPADAPAKTRTAKEESKNAG